MELQILTSKKGTKVVTAANLHQLLQLTDHHYAVNVKKWLQDVYAFHDGIRKAALMQDYAPRKLKDTPLVEDYYLTIELAKLIVLHSRSKVKQKYARMLQSEEEADAADNLLDKVQVRTILDLVKAMESVAHQEDCERRHLELYRQRNGNSAANWWQYRAELLGYSAEQLRRRAAASNHDFTGMTRRQLLMQLDRYELVRAGVIDALITMGKSERYARSMGDLAKLLAKEMRLDIRDDRDPATLFTPEVDAEPFVAVKKLEQTLRLSA